VAPRAKFYDTLAVYDGNLANTFEKVTNGIPTTLVGKAGAQLILDTLLADDAISSSETKVMEFILLDGKFDDPALELFSKKILEAIYSKDALIKGTRRIPPNSGTMDRFSASLGLGNVSKIKFTSPGTKVSYTPTQYLAIKALLDTGDITAYEPEVGPLRDNLILKILAGDYTSSINRIVVYDAYNSVDNAITTVHEATHAIQDWLDIKSTVRLCEADAYIAGTVAAVALGWTKKNFKKNSIYAVVFDNALKFVLDNKANDPNKNDWGKAYRTVTNAVAKADEYIGKIDSPSPITADILKQGQSPELDRFNALLASINKKKR